MTHPLMQTLLDHDAVTTIEPGGLEAFFAARPGRLNVVFLAGDPEKRLETADVAIVCLELLKAHPEALHIGVVARDAEAELMDATSVFALPSLVFHAGARKLETIPKIQDWSVYAETLPRLIASLREEATA